MSDKKNNRGMWSKCVWIEQKNIIYQYTADSFLFLEYILVIGKHFILLTQVRRCKLIVCIDSRIKVKIMPQNGLQKSDP